LVVSQLSTDVAGSFCVTKNDPGTPDDHDCGQRQRLGAQIHEHGRVLRLPVPPTARTRGFFTRGEALSVGWTPRAIRTQLGRGFWKQLVPGRFVEGAVFAALSREQQHRLVALATAFGRNLVVRRDSAACVHGLSVARTPAVVSTRHVTDVDGYDVTHVGGVLVTTPACTVVDCARFLGPREGLVGADSALRASATTPEELARQLDSVQGRKGSPAATFVVAEADARAETAFESVSRYEFLAAGLPRAEPNAWIGNRRVDFLWERYRLIGEADGPGKHGKTEEELRANIRAERDRQRQLEEAGYVFVRWLWAEIWFHPHLVVSRVLTKLAAAGYSVS
jgi:very-short-patch-repair endonuclease